MHIFLQPALLPHLQMHLKNKKVFLPLSSTYPDCSCLGWRMLHWCLLAALLPQSVRLHHWNLPDCLYCEVCQEES